MALRNLFFLTSKPCKRLFLNLRRQSKIDQFCLVTAHINKDVFRFNISVQNSILLAADVGAQDLSEILSCFLLCQRRVGSVSVINDPKQIFTIFWSFHHVHKVLVEVDYLVNIDHIAVVSLPLEIRFSWNSFPIQLQ